MNLSQNNLIAVWKQFLSDRNFLIQFLISMCVLGSFALIFPRFFDFVESRKGNIISDPLIEMLPAADVSWMIFSLLYFGIISWLLSVAKTPDAMLAGLQTYILVTLMRLVSITLFPFEPPVNYIPLNEPFVQLFTNGKRIISKDLFFSGHMTSILVCYLHAQKGAQKKIYFYSAVAIGILLMVQLVHYAIDIIAAPVFTYLCFLSVKKYLAVKI